MNRALVSGTEVVVGRSVSMACPPAAMELPGTACPVDKTQFTETPLCSE